jgi:flagellar motility protein MotE (MotC chaperone)
MTVRSLLTLLAVASTLTVAACGSDEESGAAAEENSTPQQAVSEIGTVTTTLDKALSQVKSGDRDAAEETLAESYTEHFEKVEGPLEKVDGDLKEEIEETLSTKIRGKVHDGASQGDIAAMIADVKQDLATAKTKLEQ